MKTKLRKKPPESIVVKEKTKIPTLEDFTDTMQKDYQHQIYRMLQLALRLPTFFRTWRRPVERTAKPHQG